MSSYNSRSPRDRSQEIEEPGVGVRGIPVDARCTGCKQVTVRRALPSDREDRRVEVSFKAPCHRCQKVTWWNSLQVLDGLLDEEHKAALGELDDDVDDPEEDDLDRGDGIETDGGRSLWSEVRIRADRAYHDVGQYHLTEFSGPRRGDL